MILSNICSCIFPYFFESIMVSVFIDIFVKSIESLGWLALHKIRQKSSEFLQLTEQVLNNGYEPSSLWSTSTQSLNLTSPTRSLNGTRKSSVLTKCSPFSTYHVSTYIASLISEFDYVEFDFLDKLVSLDIQPQNERYLKILTSKSP